MTTDLLITTDIQEAFDIMVARLADGRGRAMGQYTERTGEMVENCMYRAPDGNRCVLGVLIADEAYNPEFEGRPASSIVPTNGYISDNLYRLIGLMQSLHDGPQHWGENNDFLHWWRVREAGEQYDVPDLTKVPT